ncbi:MAG: UbiA family prenyltransferase [bacterium]
MKKIKAYIELSRPFTLLAPAVGILCGIAVAAGETGAKWNAAAALISVAAACLLNAASNTLNQLCDVDIDRINKPHRPLPSGRVAPREATGLAILLFAAALRLAWAVNLQFFALCVAAAIMTFAYSAPPLRLRRFPVAADIIIAVPRGMLLFAAGWSAAASLDHPLPWTIGGLLAFFILGAMSAKDFADIEGDRAGGIITLPVLLGARRTAILISPFLILPFLLIPVLVHIGLLRPSCVYLAFLALYGAAISVILLRDPESLSTEANHPAWKHVYLLLMATQAGFAAAYIF